RCEPRELECRRRPTGVDEHAEPVVLLVTAAERRFATLPVQLGVGRDAVEQAGFGRRRDPAGHMHARLTLTRAIGRARQTTRPMPRRARRVRAAGRTRVAARAWTRAPSNRTRVVRARALPPNRRRR